MARNKQSVNTEDTIWQGINNLLQRQDFQNFMKIPSAVLQLSRAKKDIEANRCNFAALSLKIRQKQSGKAYVRNVSVRLLFVIPTYNSA
jgi:hypothetical protein